MNEPNRPLTHLWKLSERVEVNLTVSAAGITQVFVGGTPRGGLNAAETKMLRAVTRQMQLQWVQAEREFSRKGRT